jgi:hypothetical protein
MVLGLLVFSVGMAQAETNAKWKVKGADLPSNDSLLPTIQIEEIESETGALFTEIAKAELRILCTQAELLGMKLELQGKITEGSKVKFSGCVTLLNGSMSKLCAPKTPEQPFGTIVSNELKGLLVLRESKGVLEVKPKAGEILASLRFDVPGGCALPEIVPVKGELLIQDCKSEGQVELASHLVEERFVSSHLWVISLTTEHLAFFFGSSATVVLTGAGHEGQKWSGVPG